MISGSPWECEGERWWFGAGGEEDAGVERELDEKDGAEERECERGGVWFVERDWLDVDGLREEETRYDVRWRGNWPAGEELEWCSWVGRVGVAKDGVDGRPPTDAGGGGNANGWLPPSPTEPV